MKQLLRGGVLFWTLFGCVISNANAQWSTNGNILFPTSATSVGIGTNSSGVGARLTFGNPIQDKLLALWEIGSFFYGFGIAPGTLRIQVGSTGDRFAFFAGDNLEVFGVRSDRVLIPHTSRLGIGIFNPEGFLHVNDLNGIPGTIGSSRLLTVFGGFNQNGGSYLSQRIWMVRRSSASGWGNTSFHEALDVDGAHSVPRQNTLAWNEKKPDDGRHSWGHRTQEWMTLLRGGLVVNGVDLNSPSNSQNELALVPPRPAAQLHVLGGAAMSLSSAEQPNYLVPTIRIGNTSASENFNGEVGGILFTRHYDLAQSAKISVLANWNSHNFDAADIVFSSFDRYTRPVDNVGPTLALKERARFNQYGNLLIGKTTQSNINYYLDVGGAIRANEVVVNTNGADYVFEPDYKLMPLTDLERFLKERKHLPGIVPAAEMQQEGVGLGELNTKLLEKVEELTLHLINQNKQLEEVRKRLEAVESENAVLKNGPKKRRGKQ
jgi:hypothetical protein